ncbi:MAG: integrase arm-type DNA-binding domain-containing protein [Rhodospirillaceae bacterium]
MPRPAGTPNSRPKRAPERRALTARFVETVKPESERRHVYDTKRPGLVLRVEPSGVKTWKFYYRHGGRPRWFTIGRADRVSLADARDRARALDGEVAAGRDPQADKRATAMAGTFGEMVAQYLAETANKSRDQYKAQLDRWALPRWRSQKVADVTRAEVRALHNARAKIAPQSAALLLASISAVFKWGIAEERIDVEINPCHGITSSKAATRERVLSDDDVATLWRALDDEHLTRAMALRLILLTGQRPGEVRHMRWADIEFGPHSFDTVTRDGKIRPRRFEGAWWSLAGASGGGWPGTKNGQDHRVWLTPAALALLDEADDGRREGFVFEGTRGKAIGGLDAVMRRLAFDPPARPHDLRRTHGTTTTRLGFTRDAMNRLQNHREGGIASVYDRHEYADEARRVQEAVGARIAQLVDGSDDKVVALADARR